MAGVSVGFSKCFMLFMAIVILVQGVVYLGLAIWGITLKDCQTTYDIAGNPFKFAMDLIYFVDEKCGDPIIQFYNEDIQVTMDWPKSFEVTNREYIFMIVYAAISGLWIASSFLIILTLCCATTKLTYGAIYWPWFLSVLAGCILDVVATVYHAIDISNTLSLADAFQFIGASVPDGILTFLDPFGAYFSTPAIVLTCISSRVVVIWLLNLIGGIFTLSLSHVLAVQTSENRTVSHAGHNGEMAPRQQTPQPVVLMEPMHQPTAPSSLTPQSEVEMVYPEQIRAKPLPIMIPAQNAEMMQRQSSQYQNDDRTTLQSPVLVLPPIQQAEPDNTYRTTAAHPDQLNYPASEPTTPQRPLSPAAQQIATGSALNSRYSEIYPTQPVNPRVSEELRNQMPWSYTSMITKPPPPPRKPQQQVQIYPQIPEPDYTEQ